MAGSFGSITDDKGRFAGAGNIENGGDAEELARHLYGMVQWLASSLAEAAGNHKDHWIEQAGEHAQEGLHIGGTADEAEDEY